MPASRRPISLPRRWGCEMADDDFGLIDIPPDHNGEPQPKPLTATATVVLLLLLAPAAASLVPGLALTLIGMLGW